MNIKLKTFIRPEGRDILDIELVHPSYLYRYNKNIPNAKAKLMRHVEKIFFLTRDLILKRDQELYISEYTIEIEDALDRLSELIAPRLTNGTIKELNENIQSISGYDMKELQDSEFIFRSDYILTNHRFAPLDHTKAVNDISNILNSANISTSDLDLFENIMRKIIVMRCYKRFPNKETLTKTPIVLEFEVDL